LDTARLFIKYTEKYLNAMPYAGALHEHMNLYSILDVELDYKNRKFRFEWREFSKDLKAVTNSYVKEISETDREDYLKYLKWFLLITDMEFELYN
jgi:hypothetical protein